MSDTPEVTAARIDVARRRGELLSTVHELQARLQPRTLASDAWAKAKNKGADMAEDAVDAVKARPMAVGGVAAALGLFLARQPIKDAAVKLYDALTSEDAPKTKKPALRQRK
jgi:ElaB/YqjD/DUF883 family membrane-anchored ribosome-binding protein